MTILLLHGFTGNGASMDQLGQQISHLDDELIAPDLPGHGAGSLSQHLDAYKVEGMISMLLGLFETAHVVGYSMGGRLALCLAVAAPDRVRSLSLIGASPGLPTAPEREARIAADASLAASIEADGVAAFVDRWEQIPLFASQATLSSAVLQEQRQTRLSHEAQGLANSLRGFGTGTMPPLYGHLAQLEMPVLALVGELDTKYVAIAQEMVQLLPNGQAHVVPSVGHAAHLEAPEATGLVIAQFLGTMSGEPVSSWELP